MYYVMSDIHGKYEKYMEMLKKLNLSWEDTLFILGDVVDRGEKPVEILKDMMNRPNIYPIMGNHDFVAHYILEKLSVDIDSENYGSQLSVEDMNDLIDWLHDGGSSTLSGFGKLNKSERKDILDYMSEFSMYEAVDVGEKLFLLVHAGLGNFREGKKLSEYTPDELISGRPNPNMQYFKDNDVYIVMGHTPTLSITGKPEIYKSCNNIFIDCGASYEGGKLACLCLDTMEEYYV